MKRKFNAWATGGIMVGFGLFAGCAPAPVAHRWESGPAIAAALSDAGMPADYCALVTNPMYVSSLNPPSTVGRSTCYHGAPSWLAARLFGPATPPPRLHVRADRARSSSSGRTAAGPPGRGILGPCGVVWCRDAGAGRGRCVPTGLSAVRWSIAFECSWPCASYPVGPHRRRGFAD